MLKELSKSGHGQQALELFDWLQNLPANHDLAPLADVFSYTTGTKSLDGPKIKLSKCVCTDTAAEIAEQTQSSAPGRCLLLHYKCALHTLCAMRYWHLRCFS